MFQNITSYYRYLIKKKETFFFVNLNLASRFIYSTLNLAVLQSFIVHAVKMFNPVKKNVQSIEQKCSVTAELNHFFIRTNIKYIFLSKSLLILSLIVMKSTAFRHYRYPQIKKGKHYFSGIFFL